MARTAKLLQLPVEVSEQLDAKLRANGYSDFVKLAEWLTELGHPIRKSALHEYSTALKRTDADAGDTKAIISTRGVGNASAVGESESLLLELGRLRFREAQIVARLVELGPVL